MKKALSILGSTGSIGKNCLAVARHLGKDVISVEALAVHGNIDLLEQQIKEFHPKLVAVYDADQARILKKRLPHLNIMEGMEGLKAVATYPDSNLVISAVSGAIGLAPTLAAIEAKKNVGFASKEVLVSGGALVMSQVRKHGIELIPIDSELTAIFQCLQGNPEKAVKRIIITGSGGSFRNYSDEQLEAVTIENALNHPNYRMGSKVTIDSSTLMNKGLEMIEAHWLFNCPVDKIDIVIHPQQMIHGMVEFIDNSIIAQMCEPDMLVPIQYAITYPHKAHGTLPPFDFTKHSTLQFYAPDLNKFRCLKLAYEAVRAGGSMTCYMNGANEVLVQSFLKGKISWKEIAGKLEDLMTGHRMIPLHSFDDVLAIDEMARAEAKASL